MTYKCDKYWRNQLSKENNCLRKDIVVVTRDRDGIDVF